ncbi:MAG: mercuric ion transport protein [Patiriisocius sp.]|jgi:mercuric ion transport protein
MNVKSKGIDCKCSFDTSEETKRKDGKKMSVLNTLSVVLLFLFPKCPLCWAAYASLFSFIGLESISYNSNWSYVILGLLLIGSFLLLRKHYLNKAWFSIIFYGVGISILLLTYYANLSETYWLYIILFLIALSNLSKQTGQKLIKSFKHSFFS